MPTLQELLDDAQISDELEISFGDKGKFKVSDLRAADKSWKLKMTADEQRVAASIKAAEDKRTELTTLASQAAELIAKLKVDEKPIVKEGDIDFDTDPLYGPLVTKKLKPLEEKLATMVKTIEQLTSNINDSGKFLLHDYYERRWNSIPEAQRPKDKGWRDYLKVASERHIMNEFNLPDPVEAFNREIEPQRAKLLADENAALRKQLDEAQKAPRMPRPGASGVPKPKAEGEKVYTDVDSLINDAFNDPTIQDIVGRA